MIKVIKIGGNVVDDPAALARFCANFAKLEGPKILVHGGGAVANKVQRALGSEPVKIDGRRVTDKDTLDVVTMVYSGLCNKTIVALLQKEGCDAIGLSGCDANIIKARKRPPLVIGDEEIDFGYVGDVTAKSVNVAALTKLLKLGLTPVLCAINHDGKGNLLNTNADTVAGCIAVALKAELVYCFELSGVLMDKDDERSLIPSISSDDFVALKASGIIADGMIPKIENALKAIEKGASDVIIKSASNLLSETGTVIWK